MSILAFLGGNKVIEKGFQPYQSIGDEEKKLVAQVMDSGSISAFYGSWDEHFLGGKFVRRFEEKITQLWKCAYAISVNSNTSGLDIAMGAIGISPGDEVITTPWTMSATAMAPLRWGGIPRFVDIEDDTYCLDLEKVKESINANTKAILVTNIFGHAAQLRALRKIADQHHIYLIEDNAQAPLAHEHGQYCGTIGHIGVLSFNYHKHVHTGEGGVCLTNELHLAEKLRMLRNHGEAVVEQANVKDITNMIGSNFRMTELQAAIGIGQLNHINQHIDKRAQIGEFLTEIASELQGITPPMVRDHCKHVYYCWGAKINSKKLGVSRDLFQRHYWLKGFLMR